jgi:HEAT repeat protein
MVAVVAMAGAAASAVALAVLQQDRVREEWYLWRLGSSDEETSETAARRLAELGVVRAIPRLVEIVRGHGGQEGEPFHRRKPPHAIRALESLEGPSAVPFLGPFSRDHDPDARSWALWALSRVGPGGVAAIGDALRDPNVDVRSDAANSLSRLGMDAEPAVASLVFALGDESVRVRDRAMLTLRKVGAHAVLGPLLDVFEKAPASRPFFVAALLDFYPSRLEPGDALREALKDREPRLVDAVIDEAVRIQDLEGKLLEAEE